MMTAVILVVFALVIYVGTQLWIAITDGYWLLVSLSLGSLVVGVALVLVDMGEAIPVSISNDLGVVGFLFAVGSVVPFVIAVSKSVSATIERAVSEDASDRID